jgi:5-methyltetrahydrofolate--homocysteine methyltransferase
MDGAMGTELLRAGIELGRCFEQSNIAHAESVLAIHRAYVEAGAEILLTNTFQANPAALAKHGLQNQLAEICGGAVQLARKAGGKQALVLGDIGPWTSDDAAILAVANELRDGDGLLLETLSDPCAQTVSTMVRGAMPPVLISCTFLHTPGGDLQTYTGLTPEEIAHAASSLGVAALGVNCGREIEMADIVQIVKRYKSVTQLPLFARPNAGTPAKGEKGLVYPRTPEQMASKLPELLDAGVAMVGGCCGTTPEHIAAFRPIVTDWNRQHGV